jgi:hypothetical protein
MAMYQTALATDRKEDLQELFGFTSSDEFARMIGETKKNLKAAGAPAEVVEHFEQASKEVKTIDDMSSVLNKLFAQYGDTLRWNFMVFSFGGKDHLFVTTDAVLWKRLQAVLEMTRKAGVDLNLVLKQALEKFEALPCFQAGEAEED